MHLIACVNGVSPPRSSPVAEEGSGHLVPIESGQRVFIFPVHVPDFGTARDVLH